MDGGPLALRVDIQNIYAQKPLSVGLGVLRPGGSYDATLGFDVLFGAILDVVGERLARMQPGKQRGACGWSGGDAWRNVNGSE